MLLATWQESSKRNKPKIFKTHDCQSIVGFLFNKFAAQNERRFRKEK